ncbi:MAG: lipopolysaccharide biosynthesis protein [Methylobacter sp.]
MSSLSNLTKQSVSAVKWSALGNIARYGLQLGAQIVLARLLGPENYGLFALGMTVLAFSNMLANFGLAWGLVQAQDLSEADIRFVFTWQLMSGAAAAAGLYLLAPTIADFFNESRLTAIVKWLSLACLISAATAPASNLLRRKLDFKSINIIEIASYTIGYIFIGIPLAYSGAGVWSLVSAWLAQTVCALLLSFIRSPHSIKPLIWYPGALAMTGVGSTVFVTNICNWLLNNLDRTLLGRFLSAQTVGLYSVGYHLANTPNALFIGALQPAFLAAGARIQDEPERLRNAYLSVLASVWILILPIFVVLAVVAKDLVGLLYGPAWHLSGIVLAILALSMPIYITWAMSTPILWNTSRKHWESLLQAPILAVSAFALFKLANQGVVIVAIVAACTLIARAVVITSAACYQLKIGLSDLFGFAVRGMIMTALAATATFAGIDAGHLAGIAMTPFINAASILAGIDISRIVGATHFHALSGGLLIGGGILLITPLIEPRILGIQVVQMLGRFSPSLFTFLDRRLQPAPTRTRALLAGVVIGSSVLITSPLIYPRMLAVPVTQIIERFGLPLFALLQQHLTFTSAQDGAGQ